MAEIINRDVNLSSVSDPSAAASILDSAVNSTPAEKGAKDAEEQYRQEDAIDDMSTRTSDRMRKNSKGHIKYGITTKTEQKRVVCSSEQTGKEYVEAKMQRMYESLSADWECKLLGIGDKVNKEKRLHMMMTHILTREVKAKKERVLRNQRSGESSSNPVLKRPGFSAVHIKTLREDDTLLTAPKHIYFKGCDPEPLANPTEANRAPYSSYCEDFRRIVYERCSSHGPSLWYGLENETDKTLQFESRFESGSLERVVKLASFEYELFLQVDPAAEKAYSQWFYFAVQNLRPGIEYTFHIMHFTKAESLFGAGGGCLPLLYSKHEAEHYQLGWRRIGHNVSYVSNSSKRHTLSFSFQLSSSAARDVCYFAASYPYRYSDLERYLDKLESDKSKANRVKRRLLCKSLAGNRCDLLTITSFNGAESKFSDRKGIVLTARVHPGETNASWVMKGLIDFLTGPSLDAKILRDNFVFKIIPMLNPDGVIVGNSRCSLAGVDLNRMYSEPDRVKHPTIWHLKKLIEQFSLERDILFFCDFHGHSRRNNIFVYGCEDRRNRRSSRKLDENGDLLEEKEENCDEATEEKKKKRKKKKGSKRKSVASLSPRTKSKQPLDPGQSQRVRLLPQLLAEASCVFSFEDCNFKIQKCKESSGRVCVHRESQGKILSYTLEASLGGCSIGPLEGYHLNQEHLEGMGFAFGDALVECFLNVPEFLGN